MANEKKEKVESPDKKYFKLGEGRTMFWDASQEKVENRKLLPGQVKLLEQTKRVLAAKRGEHILAADQDDVKAYKEVLAEAAKAKKEKDAEKELAKQEAAK